MTFVRKKRAGIEDGEAVVRLGGEVDDHVDLLLREHALGELEVGDVALDEPHVRFPSRLRGSPAYVSRSNATTWSPGCCSTHQRTKFEPMKPAAPVTSRRLMRQSRAERIGASVLQRCFTRGSSHGIAVLVGIGRVVLLGDEVHEESRR